MTLVLAICCSEGIVFAADSQSSFSTQGQWTKSDTEKLFVLGERILWGGSGPLGAIQRVGVELDRCATDVIREFDKRNEGGGVTLHRHVHTILKGLAEEVVEPIEPKDGALSSYLFGGLGKDGPFLLEISKNGAREWRQADNFSAIGSGDVFAMHAWRAVRHHDLSRLSLYQAQLLAYRTVEDAIATAAFGLGGVVKLGVVAADGARLLDEQELRATQDGAGIWRAHEVEFLGALAPATGAALPAVDSEPPEE